MAEFIGVHKLPAGMSEEELKAGYESYKEEAIKRGLRPMRAYFNLEKGFAYCETEAPSAEEVRTAHANVAIPLEEVIEVKTIQ